MSGIGGNIKVVVRCRPLNSKERARGATSLIRMEGNQTIISQPAALSTMNGIDNGNNSNNNGGTDDVKAFTFDRSFWSVDPDDTNYASQETVYNDLGKELLDHAFHGYNCCIFAYGQTGSGKSYSMMGYGDDVGIIPRTCSELFNRIDQNMDPNVTFCLEVTYLEIYNEKVRDLLNPRNKSNLKVREHPSLGPYVEDLSRLAVKSFNDIDNLMNEGNKARTVAATNMNETSSRSHAVFTIFLTSRKTDDATKLITEKVSRISLVDLAGSERADSTGATGARLKEGANINRSLATLGKVIAALAEKSSSLDNKKSRKSKDYFIPYRDSVLTWLLKDCLGGNSRTAMIAAISPADFEETLSTLRYADQAKRIKNKPVINEDPNAKLIRELKEELQALRDTLMTYAPEEVEKIASQTSPRILGSKSTPRLGALHSNSKQLAETSTLLSVAPLSTASSNITSRPTTPTTPAKEISFSDAFGETRKLTMTELVDQLKASQKLLDQVNQTWEEKLIKTQEIHCEREKALEAMGILLQHDNGMGIHTPKQIPHLVNLNEDPLMSECLMYQIKPGITHVGRCENDAMDIRLSGPNIMDNHCYFENDNGLVTIFPMNGSMTMVNGIRTTDQKQLHNGYRIILGDYHVFRFNHPEQVRKERHRLSSEQQQQQQNGGSSASAFSMVSGGRNSAMTDRSESIFSDRDSGNYSISGPPEIVDWNFAKREAVLNYYYSTSNKGINNNILGGDYSKSTSVLDDETMSRTTTSSIRFSNGSLPLSIGIMNDDPNSKSGYRYSGSQLSIDTGIFSAPDGLCSNIDAMDVTSDDFIEAGSSITKRYNSQLQLRRQKEEYEERIRLATLYHEQPSYIQDMEMKLQRVIEDMRCMMDNQRQAYESKIKRLSSKLPPDMLQSPLSPGTQALAFKVINKWRGLRIVLMAEELLVHAVTLKEANIIAKDLGRDVSYQYTVVHDNDMISTRSFWEPSYNSQQSTSSFVGNNNNDDNSVDLDDRLLINEDLDLRQSIKPCLGVQVIDRKHNAVYIWSLPEMKRRLKKMQNLYNFSDRPLSRDQFTWSDPFYQASCPRYSLIGLASVSIRNLAFQVPMESSVDVFDRNSGTVMGKLRLMITPIARSTMGSNNSRKGQGSVSPFSTSLEGKQSPLSSLSVSLQQAANQYKNLSPTSTMTKGDDNNGLFLHIGQQQVFEVKILELSGLNETLFTQVHAQFNLSAFGLVQKHSGEDKSYATEPVSGFGIGPIYFDYTQNMTITITDATLKTIMDGKLTFEVYGQARSEYIYGIIERNLRQRKEDEIKECDDYSGNLGHNIIGKNTTATEGISSGSSSNESTDPSRASLASLLSPSTHRKRLKFKPPTRSYTEDGLLIKERHHVVAYVQLCELGDDGEYNPVNVLSYSTQDHGCFYLRQGLQRRLKITMMHDSGVHLPWKNVTGVAISNVSLIVDKDESTSVKPGNENGLDSTIESAANAQSIGVHLHQNQPLEFYPDGTCTLTAIGLWDSSLHDFVHLNRVSAPHHRIRATLTWQVTCDKSTEPLSFSMDLHMKIHNRDLIPPNNASGSSSSSTILNYFSSALYQQYHRMSYKLRGIFSVHLSPPLTRQVSQLWRLNTANRYVRGEELLGEHGLRGVSLIQEYRQAARRMSMRQQVETTQHILAMMDQQQKREKRRLHQPQKLETMVSRNGDSNCILDTSYRNTGLLNKVLELWTKRFGTQKEVYISQKPPPSPTDLGSSTLPIDKEDVSYLKLAPRVKYVLPSATVVKKGYLWHPKHTKTNVWVKHWFTLKRPFIMVYEDQTEIDEIAIIDLTSVRVEHKTDVEESLQKPNTFAIHTTNNVYLFQAKSNADMIDWMTKIDQFYPVENLEP